MNLRLTMNAMLGVVILFAATARSEEDLKPIREKVEKQIANLPVEAHFDQPYAGTDNPKQMVDLFLPKNRKSDKPLPVVVFIHGGGWVNGDRIKSASAVVPYVLSGDYAGVAVSYRLSGEAKWPAQIFDCKAAIRWIRGNAKKYNLDPDHIAVMGGSAGGHLSSLLGTSGGVEALEGDLGEFTSFSSQVTCVVNFCGPEDFKMTLMYKDGKPVVNDPAVSGLLGGPLAEKQDAVVAASPVTYVTKDDAPFLTLHGTKDERVDFKHAERIHAVLTEAGVPSILIPITDAGHNLWGAPEIPDRVGKFVARHLRGATVEIPSEPIAKQ